MKRIAFHLLPRIVSNTCGFGHAAPDTRALAVTNADGSPRRPCSREVIRIVSQLDFGTPQDNVAGGQSPAPGTAFTQLHEPDVHVRRMRSTRPKRPSGGQKYRTNIPQRSPSTSQAPLGGPSRLCGFGAGRPATQRRMQSGYEVGSSSVGKSPSRAVVWPLRASRPCLFIRRGAADRQEQRREQPQAHPERR